MSTRTRYSAEDRDFALGVLREHLAPGTVVYTVLRHRSRSGMQRSISLFVGGPADRPGGDTVIDLSFFAARAMGERIDRERGGIVVGGCGMDMGFHLVYNLGRTLYPDGIPAGADGGYSLVHRWL